MRRMQRDVQRKSVMKKCLNLMMVLLGFLASCKSPDLIREPARSYNADEIAGSWFGFAQGDLYLYRIHLARSGSGVGAYSSNVSELCTGFKIESWSVNRANHLVIEVGSDFELRAIEGNLVTSSMFLGVVYGSSGWSNTVSFYKLAPFAQRMKGLREIVVEDLGD